KGGIDLVLEWLKTIKVSYTQPNGSGESLPGVPSPTSDFFAEALDQHDHKYYLRLLGTPTVPIAAPHTRASSKKKLRNVSSPIKLPWAPRHRTGRFGIGCP